MEGGGLKVKWNGEEYRNSGIVGGIGGAGGI